MRWVKGGQNQRKQGCGPPMGLCFVTGSLLRVNNKLGERRVVQSPLQTTVLAAPHSLASGVNPSMPHPICLGL